MHVFLKSKLCVWKYFKLNKLNQEILLIVDSIFDWLEFDKKKVIITWN